MSLNLHMGMCCWCPSNDLYYTAFVKSDSAFSDQIQTVHRLDNPYNNNNEPISHIVMIDCPMMLKIPENLSEVFPNLVTLCIETCGLKNISRKDVKGLENLCEINFTEMNIEELPGDLFKDLINLEVIKLQKNKIKFIGRNIFAHLKKITFVNLSENPSIDLVFASNIYDEVYAKHSHEYTGEKTERIKDFEEFNKIVNKTFNRTLKCATDVWNDLQKLLQSDNLKDFTIKIGGDVFKVHKFILAARSPTLAEMIKNNPDADELILEDIEVEVFKIILDYIYTGELSENCERNLVKLYLAAGKLKFETLKEFIGENLCDSVGPNNCFDVLINASKFKDEELKKKAFEEVKKLFPDKKFENSLMDNIEMLRKMKKIREDFEKLFMN